MRMPRRVEQRRRARSSSLGREQNGIARCVGRKSERTTVLEAAIPLARPCHRGPAANRPLPRR